MKTFLSRLAAVAVFVVAVQPAAASSPAIDGEISGVELCPQFGCNAAIFSGTCDCRVRGRQAPGFFWVAVQHEELPDVNQAAAIIGGRWNLTTLRGSFSGRVIDGTIINNGDNTFDITATLRLQKRGSGEVIVEGVLDHNDFPPTFEGELRQPVKNPIFQSPPAP
jgi:hypothetical protein